MSRTDRAVLERLYRRHRGRLVAYAAGAVGWADAEDVVHDAFASLLRARSVPFDDVGTAIRAVQHAVCHFRRYTLQECRDARRTDRIDRDHTDPRSLEDLVCGRVVLAAYLRALEPAERRGLFRSLFVPGTISGRDKSSATNARKRLRTLRSWHGL